MAQDPQESARRYTSIVYREVLPSGDIVIRLQEAYFSLPFTKPRKLYQPHQQGDIPLQVDPGNPYL